MGGGLMQLVAYGAQDIYLTGQPQITYFKSVYRRHTNFAIESILQTINGTAAFGNRISVTISRNGDLLKNLWVQYNPKEILSVCSSGNKIGANVGHSLFQYVELEIGGQLIDRQYGSWLTIWNYLTEENATGVQSPVDSSNLATGLADTYGVEPGSADSAYNMDFYRATRYQHMSFNHRGMNLSDGSFNSGADLPTEAYVPMQFWFCKNPGLAVPLIALQYHEVKFNVFFNQFNAISDKTGTTGSLNGVKIYADYVYLDTTERRQFAQNAHEYLIDQVQNNLANVGPAIRMTFNHPVKELVWIKTPRPVDSAGLYAGLSSPAGKLSPGTYKIGLNGTDRFTERDVRYFTRLQVYDCHTGYGSVLFPDSVAVYSFALRPEEHQPSGTCNFSRIDTAQLIRSVAESTESIDIFAVNYNVLRIMSGMGGLAYSN